MTTFRAPSNRSFIAQMVKWGWTEGRQDGRWQTMWGPPIGKCRGESIQVRPAQQHDANPTTVFKEVYRLTCEGDVELFWRGPSSAWLQMLYIELERQKAEQKAEQDRQLQRAAQRAARQAAAHTPAPEPAPQPTRKEEPVTRKFRIDIRGSDILSHMVRHDQVYTVHDICTAFNLDYSNDDHRHAVNARLDNLVRSGGAVRVKRGVFRVSPSYRSVSARVQHDVGPQVAATVETPIISGNGQLPEPATVVESNVPATPQTAVTPAQVAETIDDTIEAVLDLLLPNGFKASHLRYIAPWVDATKAMVEAVNR